MENKSKSEIRRIEHVKECERDREFDKWYVSKMEKASEMFNGKQDGLMIAIKPICKSAWLEARKGYVELKKIEDILDLDSVPCPCDASKSGCEHLVCTGYLLEEIKELAEKGSKHNENKTA